MVPKESLVDITTDYGVMRVKLYDETPKHRDNFLKLVKEGYYDGLLFHRVINGFMVQGGDPQSKNAAPGTMLGNGGPGYTIPAEFNPARFHKKGALAAARMGDQVNPNKESSGSQFYIVQGKPASEQELTMTQQRINITYTPEQRQVYTTAGGTPFLDMGYTVFGEVVSGLEVIDKIAAVQTQPGDRPVQDVKMTMKIVE
ncbi:MAG: peptidylprolyl isomerase [Bacteroidetes bacterium]|nr:peptidylprolyl isomerase [Bacteroidota bacterium]HNR20176.1 peptidylprolyl isomerase [Bacteroidia bacterium]HNU34692.1 peptidylprolyl isomerase [Bacteroidia bacterium]